MAIFTSDPMVAAEAIGALMPVGFAQPVWAIVFVLSGALRGAGNTRFPLLMTTIMGWGNTAIALVATGPLGLGLPWAWAGFVIIAPLTTLLTIREFRKGRWKEASYQAAT